MAQMGMTFVDAINEVVETIFEFPMSGITKPSGQSDTTSVYYRAEQFIDRENRRIQSWGWPENTRLSKVKSADSGVQTITFSADEVLKVRSSGPDGHRNLVLRKTGSSTGLYDADLGSFNITAVADGDVYLDITELLDFDYLPLHLQDVIVARAKMTFQRRMQGNPQLDVALNQEYMQAEALALRNKPELDQNWNIRPMIPGASAPAESKGE